MKSLSIKLPHGLVVLLALNRRGFAFGPPTVNVHSPVRHTNNDNRRLVICLWAETQDNTNNNNADDARRRQQQRQIPYYSAADTDVWPKRASSLSSSSSEDEHYRYSKLALHDWGIEQYNHPEFPSTIHSVADAAFDAISSTLHQEQRLDPNLASNAMAQNSVFDYRPTKKQEDLGRLGIEIDGVHLLQQRSTLGMDSHHTSTSSMSALRQLILVLAGKLSHNLVREYQYDLPPCPVAIYFNTVKQALAASQQLQILQQLQQQQQQSSQSQHDHHHHHQRLSPSFQNITILCLSQNDDLPWHMTNHHNTTHSSFSAAQKSKRGRKPKQQQSSSSRQKGTLAPGIYPSHGIVMVVQPTDFNHEFKPPGPAFGVVSSFQRLVARASLEGLPVIMVSPRLFTMMDDNDDKNNHGYRVGAATGRGWDQSVGSQQAATYGGLEPPTGPTPWILRDFNPPVFCWVGNAVNLLRHPPPTPTYQQQQRHQLYGHKNPNNRHQTTTTNEQYSQIALTQTVMDEGHPWHVFAARRELSSSSSTFDHSERRPKRRVVYDYLASTKPSSGRPTKEILYHILSEFGDDGATTL